MLIAMVTGTNFYIPGAWVTKMVVSPTFQEYLASLSKDPCDSILSKITNDCVREVTRFFSIDFALDVRTFYDLDLYSRRASEKQISTPGDVIAELEESTFSIYIKPRVYTRENREVIVLGVVEPITKILIRFLFPDSNQATREYYTVVIMWEKIFHISLSDKEKQDVRLNIQDRLKQEVQEIPQLTRESSLSCPHCQSHSSEFLGLQSTGTVEYKAGVPVLSGKKEDIVVMAYYKCEKCGRAFYAKPEKSA